MEVNAFWERFLLHSGLPETTECVDTFSFGMTEALANELLRLVLIGQKHATSSSFLGYAVDGDRVPQVGDLSIVTDWDGEPHCVIKTTGVRILPYREITFDLAKLEGEDDTLESWQKGHTAFFKAEGAELGYEFTEDMPVVFEEFEVIYQR